MDSRELIVIAREKPATRVRRGAGWVRTYEGDAACDLGAAPCRVRSSGWWPTWGQRPGKCSDLLEQGPLVAFDGQHVVGVRVLDQVGSGVGLGVQYFRGDHHAAQIEVGMGLESASLSRRNRT